MTALGETIDAVRRLEAARHLFTRHQLREAIAFTPHPSLRFALIAGAQATLSVLVATLLVGASPWPDLVGFSALGAFASLFGRYAPWPRRMAIVNACAALLTGAVLLASLASCAGASPTQQWLLLALIAGGATLCVAHWRLSGPGAVIFTFTAAAAMGPVASWQAVVGQTLATAAGGIMAWLVCGLSDRLRSAVLERLIVPPMPHRPLRHEVIAAGRIAAGTVTAALLAQAAGWSHPAWAAIGVLAVLQGSHLHVTMSRALQRMAGTLAGVLLAGAVLAPAPPAWVLIAAVVLLVFATEMVIGCNYALGQVVVTPMALIMTYLAAPAAAADMPVERLLETTLGVTLGIVSAILFSTADDRAHLKRHRESQRSGMRRNRPVP